MVFVIGCATLAIQMLQTTRYYRHCIVCEIGQTSAHGCANISRHSFAKSAPYTARETQPEISSGTHEKITKKQQPS